MRKNNNEASENTTPTPKPGGKRSAKAKQEHATTGADIKPETGSLKATAQQTAKSLNIEDKAQPGPEDHLPVDNIANPTPETNMEVHHHPQLEHKHKPWKEYLLEGFMIFIAVMMGFIAENIRDDINNNEHTRQLTAQLVHDLKADTAQLNDLYKNEQQIVNYNDTLLTLLKQPLIKANLQKIQWFIAGSHSTMLFHASTGAINAIKNELHLKQFSNSEIISYISEYEAHIDLMHTVQDITFQYQRNSLDPFLYKHFTPANLDAVFNRRKLPDAEIRNLTQEDLTTLATEMILIRINSNEVANDNRQLKTDATKLLMYVNQQFHPQD